MTVVVAFLLFWDRLRIFSASLRKMIARCFTATPAYNKDAAPVPHMEKGVWLQQSLVQEFFAFAPR